MNMGEDETDEAGIWSDTTENYTSTCLKKRDSNMKEQMLEKFANYITEGSNWRLKEVIIPYIKIYTNKPLRGSRYVELPKSV